MGGVPVELLLVADCIAAYAPKLAALQEVVSIVRCFESGPV